MNNLIEENIYLKPGNDFIFEDTGGCISSLRHIPPGEVWPQNDIRIRKESLFERGRDWQVVDNLIVHESIKQGTKEKEKYTQYFRQSLINLSESGIKVVCFNFMPVFYKVRTHYTTSYPGKHIFSLFDITAFAAFDLYILRRKDAEQSYSSYQRHSAKCYIHNLGDMEKATLTENILSSVQSDSRLTLEALRCQIERYRSLSDQEISGNLRDFKEQVMPFAESVGIKLHHNSDNPCANLLGLPFAS